tara:strand:+ start:329 stop:781 length:453 start_codon:yes stop_codon:yes gene_type:complete
MEYKAREFSKKSYDDNDEYAKKKISNFLIKKGHKIIQYEENYNHDLITEKNESIFYFEFEVKRNYPFTNKEDYKFNTVSFLGRKIRLHNIQPFYYMILCYETDAVVYSHSSDIFKDEYKETLNLNKHNRKGNDEMYRVPIDECSFLILTL